MRRGPTAASVIQVLLSGRSIVSILEGGRCSIENRRGSVANLLSLEDESSLFLIIIGAGHGFGMITLRLMDEKKSDPS